jgi:hypothetical protein
VVDSRFSAHRLQIRRGDFQIVGSKSISVPRLTFGMLDATYGPDSLCLSETGGPVRCLDNECGRERWRYMPPADHHVLAVSYQADRSFYCVQWDYERGGPVELIRLSHDDGACAGVCSLNTFADACSFGIGVILTSSGDVVSLWEGSFIRRFAFPRCEYPDPEPDPSPNPEAIQVPVAFIKTLMLSDSTTHSLCSGCITGYTYLTTLLSTYRQTARNRSYIILAK